LSTGTSAKRWDVKSEHDENMKNKDTLSPKKVKKMLLQPVMALAGFSLGYSYFQSRTDVTHYENQQQNNNPNTQRKSDVGGKKTSTFFDDHHSHHICNQRDTSIPSPKLFVLDIYYKNSSQCRVINRYVC
jgi:hypothetical protein